jgi:hypothetical protein
MGLWQRWVNDLKGTFNAGWLVCAAAATLGVLGLTHIPQQAIPNVLQFDRYDKLEHIGAYGLMAALYMLALKRQPDSPIAAQGNRKRRRWEARGWLGLALLAAIGLATIGAADELTQPYVHRSCDIWDWTSDAIGIAGACAIFLVRRAIVGY